MIGLADEKINWTHRLNNYKNQNKSIVGDITLCASMIAYMGAFGINYRDKMIEKWKRNLILSNV